MDTGERRMLIVDDEPNVTFTLLDTLESLIPQYQIDIANTSHDALRLIEQNSYALVLTDYRMPGMTGLELAQEIRRRSPHTRVILMTAYSNDHLRHLIANEQLSGFIEKPFSNQKIREYIKEVANAHVSPLAFVIEDNRDSAYLFSRALAMEGFQVETFYDGLTAQNRLKAARPNLVVLDMHLPGTDGATLLSQIRSSGHLEDTIVFVATADNLAGELSRGMADLVLQKPVAFSQLRHLAKRYKFTHSPQ
jgi:CheY-like chemotaxis protein